MKRLSYETMKSSAAIVEFVNRNKIKQSEIQKIFYDKEFFSLVLIYWRTQK